uniref:alanine transaminase n=1 Tax=Neogobius melanostomus TaxID=47308 RepID=A0A8C6V202_9GOBI
FNSIKSENTKRQVQLTFSSTDVHIAKYKNSIYDVQVLSACIYPELLKNQTFPVDVRQRAQTLLDACGERSVGSYTDSSGLNHVRQSVAEFITRRDGVPCSASNVFISSGSQRVMVKLIASGEGDVPTGVLTPVPCRHTLPMMLDFTGVTLEPYMLDKDRGWAVDMNELHRAVNTARGRCQPKAIFISNPGNPTGHVQGRKSIQDVIRFAAAERLLLLVDEVYQEYVFEDAAEFISYKKILFEMGPMYSDTFEMASFHSISSLGECGLRAGYMELVNIEPGVTHFVDTMLCTDISTPVTGQLAIDVMINPPKPGDSSYHTYTKEKEHVKDTLKWNCQKACEVLNNLPGVSCQPVMGGIYLYPCVTLPEETMKQAKVEAGPLYCEQLMQGQAVLIGPGCTRGLPAGTHHFRNSWIKENIVVCII